MEIYNVGQHCDFSGCKQLDFLPFNCEQCKRVYCLDHRNPHAHSCSVVVSREKPQCPLCGQLLVVGPQSDPNDIISRHIDAGCPTEAGLPTTRFKCSMPNCSVAEVTRLDCVLCHQNYCVSHRQPPTHNCTKGTPQPDPARAQKLTWWMEKLSEIRSTFDAKRLGSHDPTAQKVTIMKHKGTALGAKSVPDADRLYLEVIFPFETTQPPKWMFFNKNHVLGRALDSIAEAGKIRNDNNKSGARKLVLVDLKKGVLLPLSVPLKDCLNGGDIIMLEYEDKAPAS